MSPSRSYLVHAIYDWMLENGKTPFLMVNTTVEGVDVPPAYITDDEIVLSILPDSVTHFAMSHRCIEFKARFAGKLKHIFVPMQAVKALYTKEDMIGIGFSPEGMPYFVGDVAGDLDEAPEDFLPMQAKESNSNEGSKTKRDGPPYLTLVD